MSLLQRTNPLELPSEYVLQGMPRQGIVLNVIVEAFEKGKGS
jgi:hypothetical protein